MSFGSPFWLKRAYGQQMHHDCLWSSVSVSVGHFGAAASPRVLRGKLAINTHCSPPARRLAAQVGHFPPPREGVGIRGRRLPGVECVAGWDGRESQARDFLNRLSPFRGYQP